MQFFSMKKNRVAGFTLIELLVVIAIIGVLASIVLASLNSARQKSRDARRIADVKQIQLALELYYDSQSTPSYPVAASTCDATHANGLEALATGGFIPQIPKDPQGGCYKYSTNASSPYTTYHLGAVLEQTTNPVLTSDKDCDSTTGTGCPVAGYGPASTPFAGADPIYDVVP